MANVGRKRTDISRLVFWEQHWWTILRNLRDGIPGQESEHLSFPKEYWPKSKPEWMTHPGAIHDWEKQARERWLSHLNFETRTKGPIPPELDLWNALKNATSVRQVRRICRRSQWSDRLAVLRENAQLFIEALRSSRYPHKATTKDDQRLLYCARALAGIACRVPVETAVDKLRRLKHPCTKACNCRECQAIKQAVLQNLLYACFVRQAVSTKSVSGLVELDEPCKCSHCSIVNQVKSRRVKRTRENSNHAK
jgi:hypothetical protein